MTALLEKAFAQVKQLPDADQDTVTEILLQTLTEFKQEKQQIEKKPCPQFGSAKGMFTLSPDFDTPMEDFQD